MNAEIIKEKIDQICDEIKSKNVTIGRLDEELKRTKIEPSDEKKWVGILNCGEIRNLRKTAHCITGKIGTLHDDVVKLNIEITSKNEEVEKKQRTIIYITKLGIKQAQKIVYLIHEQNKKDQSNKIAVF